MRTELTKTNFFCNQAKLVIESELNAINALKNRIDQHFEEACELILNCKGHVIVIGMGKSGHIGNKIAATLASTGTPAFFVHPAEASHGDLGMITSNDLVIAISYSGETLELLNILPYLKQNKVPMIALSRRDSSLSNAAQIVLDIGFAVEACPLALAPTSSTTVSVVLGDAIAIAVSVARGLTKEHFSQYHPGGFLGKRLLLTVADVMHRNEQLPKVRHTANLNEALMEMTQKRLGMTTVVDEQGKLLGVFTDGDLRRALQNYPQISEVAIAKVMTTRCITIESSLLAVKALEIMEEHKITSLVVTNSNHQPIGVVHMHDLLQLGLYNP